MRLGRGLPIRRARHHECALTGDVDFDVVALLQLQRLDDGSGKTDGQAVAPFANLHGGYTLAREGYLYQPASSPRWVTP